MVKSKQMTQVKKAPVGVQIISILYYIGAILSALLGLLMIVAAGYMASLLPELDSILGSGLFIVFGVIMIGFGVLSFFIGKNLWNLKSWARIVVIIFAALGIISVISSMIKNFMVREIITLAIHAVIGGYLLFSDEVKKAFK